METNLVVKPSFARFFLFSAGMLPFTGAWFYGAFNRFFLDVNLLYGIICLAGGLLFAGIYIGAFCYEYVTISVDPQRIEIHRPLLKLIGKSAKMHYTFPLHELKEIKVLQSRYGMTWVIIAKNGEQLLKFPFSPADPSDVQRIIDRVGESRSQKSGV